MRRVIQRSLSFALTVVALSFLISHHTVEANPERGMHGFVTLASGTRLYVEYDFKNPELPTIVFLNGMTHDHTYFRRFLPSLFARDYNILSYDMRNQGETVRLQLRAGPPQTISYWTQLHDLKALLDRLSISRRVILVGLSYGASIGLAFTATYPERVSKAVLIAPYISHLQRANAWVEKQISEFMQKKHYRSLFYNRRRSLYRKYLAEYVRSAIYPFEYSLVGVPSGDQVLAGLFKGMSEFNGFEWTEKLHSAVSALPPKSIHLVFGGKDEFVTDRDFKVFRKSIPRSLVGAFLYIMHSRHRVPEEAPNLLSSWLQLICEDHPVIKAEKSFIGEPLSGALFSKRTFLLGKPESNCRRFLKQFNLPVRYR